MKTPIYYLSYLYCVPEFIAKLCGYDMFIESDDTGTGLLDFEVIRESPSCVTYFGLGHRVAVSNMRIWKKAQALRIKAEAP